MATLDHVLDPEFQVVAKIVEAEFVIGAVGDITAIGGAAGLVIHIADDAADTHPEAFIDAPHPAGVARGQIVVHGDDMDTVALQRIQEHRQGGDKGLALAGLHFRNLSLMEGDAAHQLYIVMALAKGALGGLANPREGFGEQIIKRGAAIKPGAQIRHRAAELFIAERGNLILQGIDRRHLRGEFLDRAVVPRPEQAFRQRP